MNLHTHLDLTGIDENADPADEKKSAKGDIRENADSAGGKKSAKGGIEIKSI